MTITPFAKIYCWIINSFFQNRRNPKNNISRRHIIGYGLLNRILLFEAVDNMSLIINREIDVESKITHILEKFIGKKFNNITISRIVRQYDRSLEGKRADIAVLKEDDNPLLIIETKKKYEARGFR